MKKTWTSWLFLGVVAFGSIAVIIVSVSANRDAEAKSAPDASFKVSVTATDNNRAVLIVQPGTSIELIHVGDSTFKVNLDLHGSSPEIAFSNKTLSFIRKFDKPDLVSDTFFGAMVDDRYELEIQLKKGDYRQICFAEVSRYAQAGGMITACPPK